LKTHRLWGTLVFSSGFIMAGATLTRRLARRSGATTSEVYRTLPGDELVPHPCIETTRAITIDASITDVWPWVVQVGYHRGGWYTNPRLDMLIWHIDNPSADRILSQVQHVRVGDIVPDGPEATARFIVAALIPGQLLALLDANGTQVPNTQFSWVFALRPIDSETTRLILRTWATYPVRWWTTLVAYLALGPADFLMAYVMMLRGIKQRAERASLGDGSHKRDRHITPDNAWAALSS